MLHSIRRDVRRPAPHYPDSGKPSREAMVLSLTMNGGSLESRVTLGLGYYPTVTTDPRPNMVRVA